MAHWNKVYSQNELQKLGWYEDFPEESIKLIEACNLESDARILSVGAGASTLIDVLLDRGHEGLVANDLSEEALKVLKLRLGEKASRVEWIVDDLKNPKYLTDMPAIDLWHDRAVLHFFKEESQRAQYMKVLRTLVKVGAYVIIASFNLASADKCSGLPVYRYDFDMLEQLLGNDFEPITHFNSLYTMPSGDKRNYIYALFRRLS